MAFRHYTFESRILNFSKGQGRVCEKYMRVLKNSAKELIYLR
jgi:hypothetical protein